MALSVLGDGWIDDNSSHGVQPLTRSRVLQRSPRSHLPIYGRNHVISSPKGIAFINCLKKKQRGNSTIDEFESDLDANLVAFLHSVGMSEREFRLLDFSKKVRLIESWEKVGKFTSRGLTAKSDSPLREGYRRLKLPMEVEFDVHPLVVSTAMGFGRRVERVVTQLTGLVATSLVVAFTLPRVIRITGVTLKMIPPIVVMFMPQIILLLSFSGRFDMCHKR